MLCTQNIIIDKVRHTVEEVRIGIYYQLFFCFTSFPNTFFGQKTLYRVQKFVTLLRATDRSYYYCFLFVFKFQKHAL